MNSRKHGITCLHHQHWFRRHKTFKEFTGGDYDEAHRFLLYGRLLFLFPFLSEKPSFFPCDSASSANSGCKCQVENPPKQVQKMNLDTLWWTYNCRIPSNYLLLPFLFHFSLFIHVNKPTNGMYCLVCVVLVSPFIW